MSSLTLNCGSKVIASCQNKTIPMTEAGWQALFGELSSNFLFMIKFMTLTMGSVLSTNQVMMLNSLRCMFTSGFENGWYFLGAIYYFAL